MGLTGWPRVMVVLGAGAGIAGLAISGMVLLAIRTAPPEPVNTYVEQHHITQAKVDSLAASVAWGDSLGEMILRRLDALEIRDPEVGQ